MYFDNNAKTYFRSCGTSGSPLLDGFIFRNGAGTDILTINGNGTIIGNGTALTNLNYNAILNKPTLIDYNNPATFMSTLNVSGITTLQGNLDCGGGIAITGANAFYNTPAVDAGNLTNTYINFKGAGAGNDWCYLRQIGGNENIKLAFDFLDDANDARFCIRQNASVNNPDTITEVFTVDNGNVSCTGTLTTSGVIYLNGDNLQFPNTLNQYKINLYGTNSYGFGIAGGTLMYSSQSVHNFYNSSNNVNTFSIDASGNITATGSLSAGNTAVIKGTSESDLSTIYLATPYTTVSAFKCAI
jgi:hypothetical protein